VGSAATVAAVSVAVSLIGASGGGQSSRLATGPSVDLAGAVPWIDASAQPYRPPTVSPPAPPATDARPCTADEASAVWFSVMVSISDGDVAALARAAVDRIDTDLEVRIEPADPVDPYRWEFAAWMVYAGLASSYVVASMTEDEVLEKLTRDLAP
jgi:hypothetical protein